MSSLLNEDSSLEKIHWSKAYWLGFTKRVRSKNTKHYLIVRHPERRLESFFKAKCRISARRQEKGPWQNCQQIILDALNSNRNDFDHQKSELLALSFSEFIALLPLCYNKDGHLRPQSSKIYVRNMYDRFLQMEATDDIKFMMDELGLEMDHRSGNTDEFQEDLSWSSNMHKIVSELYTEDFNNFHYANT